MRDGICRADAEAGARLRLRPGARSGSGSSASGLDLQRQIDSLLEQGPTVGDAELDELLARKMREARAAHSE